jgi:hypothetical protein
VGCEISSASLSAWFGFHFEELVGGVFVGGCERAAGGRMVLVGTGDGCWLCRSGSSVAGLGWLLWSSSFGQ